MLNQLNHLAIICDGNGRWATQRGMLRIEGHNEGLHKLEEITRWAKDFGIPVLSAYIFSLDNWKRPKEEVDNLLDLANQYFSRYPEFIENDVRVLISGVEDGFPEEVVEKGHILVEKTKDCESLTLNLCANYGGRREIVDAIAKGARTEEEITACLYNDLPMPDLIIRTGGHQRLSDFLLWQSAYAELAFTPTLFPDFTKAEMLFHMRRFKTEVRNFGGVTDGADSK